MRKIKIKIDKKTRTGNIKNTNLFVFTLPQRIMYDKDMFDKTQKRLDNFIQNLRDFDNCYLMLPEDIKFQHIKL